MLCSRLFVSCPRVRSLTSCTTRSIRRATSPYIRATYDLLAAYHRRSDSRTEPVRDAAAGRRLAETSDNAPFDEGRWDAWVFKHRRADAAFTQKVRMLAMLGVTVGMAAGTVWIFLG